MPPKELDISLRTGHRERLRQNFLDDNLAKYELLELLLSYAIPRKDVRPLARILFKKFGGIYNILCASISDLETVPGLGHNTAIFIKVVHKILIEGYHASFKEGTIFHNRETFDNYCMLILGGKPVEEMHILYMDVQHRLIMDELHSTGVTDQTTLHTEKVLRKAFELNAKFVVLIHNHPTPFTSFSTQDVEITQKLKTELALLQIILEDHFVVSGDIVYSMVGEHLLK